KYFCRPHILTADCFERKRSNRGTKISRRCLTGQSTPRQARTNDKSECRLRPDGGITMFSELFESVARPTTKRKKWAVVISGTLQSVCLLILLIVPLIYTEALPEKIFKTTWVGPPQPARTEAQAPTERVSTSAFRRLNHGVLMAPGRIPATVSMIREALLPPEPPVGQGPI